MAQIMEHLFLINEGARDHPSAATQAFVLAHSGRLTEYPLPSYSLDYHPIEYLWKKTKQQATHNKYFKEQATLTVSVDKALAYSAMHSEEMLGLFGRYCEESSLELKQAAQISISQPERLQLTGKGVLLLRAKKVLKQKTRKTAPYYANIMLRKD